VLNSSELGFFFHTVYGLSPWAIGVEPQLPGFDRDGIKKDKSSSAVRNLKKTWCCSLLATVLVQAICCTWRHNGFWSILISTD